MLGHRFERRSSLHLTDSLREHVQAAHPAATNGRATPKSAARAKARTRAKYQLPPEVLLLLERDINAAVGVAVSQV